jgi:16S rRNA (guanine527-N7)-methyltransferase
VGAVNRLADGARKLGIPLTDDQLGLYQVYYETLIDWNQRVNLTRITDYEEVQTKHFLDSLSCWEAIARAWDVWAGETDVSFQAIDVGSGGGFPGVALKIALPALRLTLLEATGKKAEFLQILVERLGLADVMVMKARAEEVGQDPEHRERYDLALARALAEMATLAELTLPLVRVGGLVIAQKGENPLTQVEAAQKAIRTLGGQVKEISPAAIPGLDGARHLVVLEKVSLTPSKYPRRPGMPAKRPLA